MSDHLLAVLEEIHAGRSTANDSETSTLDFKQPSKDGDGETKRTLLEAALCLANSNTQASAFRRWPTNSASAGTPSATTSIGALRSRARV